MSQNIADGDHLFIGPDETTLQPGSIGKIAELFNGLLNLSSAVLNNFDAQLPRSTHYHTLESWAASLFFWGQEFGASDGRIDCDLQHSVHLRDTVLAILISIAEVLKEGLPHLFPTVEAYEELLQASHIVELIEDARVTICEPRETVFITFAGIDDLFSALKTKSENLNILNSSLEYPAGYESGGEAFPPTDQHSSMPSPGALSPHHEIDVPAASDVNPHLNPNLKQGIETTSVSDPYPKSDSVRPGPDTDNAEVRYQIEYRSTETYTDLATTSSSQLTEALNVHKGPAFDVVMVDYMLGETLAIDHRQANISVPLVHGPGRSYIRIYSRTIANALRSVVKYYPHQELDNLPIKVKWPYAVLVHHWDELERFRAAYDNSFLKDEAKCVMRDTYDHLGLLIAFLEETMGKEVRAEYERWNQPIPVASFEMLWLLLKPGIDVYQYTDVGQFRQSSCVSCLSPIITNGSWYAYDVEHWFLENNSTSVQPRLRVNELTRFNGEMPIHELNLFPCKYLPDHYKQLPFLIERGRFGAQLIDKRYMYYDGETNESSRHSVTGYVVIDHAQWQASRSESAEGPENLAVELHSPVFRLPRCVCARCLPLNTRYEGPNQFRGYEKIDLENARMMTDHQYFIFTNSMPALVLAERAWKILPIVGFQEPHWEPTLIESLILPIQRKEILCKAIQFHLLQTTTPSHLKPSSSQLARSSNVVNKGRSLVVLLHGATGVGKTYTAECISQFVQAPLLSLNPGDLGMDALLIEKKLRWWFGLAHRLGAILLIEDADIYLDEPLAPYHRPGTQSTTFFRAIEQYTGILFITTSRIGPFAQAAQSRVHMTFHYDLTNEQRHRIWLTHLDKIEMEHGDEVFVPENTKEYLLESAKVKNLGLNGHQIKHAIELAITLAQANEKAEENRIVVKREHFQAFIDQWKEFQDHTRATPADFEDQRAVQQSETSAYKAGSKWRDVSHAPVFRYFAVFRYRFRTQILDRV